MKAKKKTSGSSKTGTTKSGAAKGSPQKKEASNKKSVSKKPKTLPTKKTKITEKKNTKAESKKTIAEKPVQAAPAKTVALRKKAPTKNSGKSVERFDVKGNCRVIGCNSPATTGGYSRTCYIKYWKQIKQKEEIIKQGTLERFLRELVEKYPDRVLLAIHHDLNSEEAYAQMIRELDLYGGIDELEHEAPITDDDHSDNNIDDIKKDIGGKEEDLF